MHFFHFCIALFFKFFLLLSRSLNQILPVCFLKKVLQICKNWLNFNQKGFAKFPNKNQKKSEKKQKTKETAEQARSGQGRTHAHAGVPSVWPNSSAAPLLTFFYLTGRTRNHLPA
jgi:hypothetical protein